MAEEKISEAIRVLTEAGYTVTPPRCPECNGRGFVMVSDGGMNGKIPWGMVGNARCPRGCALRMTYNRTPNDFGTKPMPPRPMNAGIPTDARSRSTRTHDL